jgi:hypothetical protein
MGREYVIIEADNADIFWYPYALLFSNLQNAVCHLVISGKNGVGPFTFVM